MSTSFDTLPTEIIWNIISLLTPIDLSYARLVCKRLKIYCDHPANWNSIHLEPPMLGLTTSSQSKIDSTDVEGELPLWTILDLKKILEPHLLFIQTIKVWGVRDNIIQYFILNCPHLEDLTILGWSTLSDHALRIPAQPSHSLSLRRLRLSGQKKSNFTSLDAATFGNLIVRCPQLEELSVICCQVHIQAESLIECFDLILQKKQTSNLTSNINSSDVYSLKNLTVATKRTWSKHHVTRLFQLCSNLSFLALVPESKHVIEQADKAIAFKPVMNNNEPVLEKDTATVNDQDIEDASNIIIYSL